MSEPGKRGVKPLYLVLALVGVLFILLVIVPVFGRARESARTQFVPGVGVIGADGKPMLAAGHAYGGGGGGMRGARGGGGGMALREGGEMMGAEPAPVEYQGADQEAPAQRAPGFAAVARSAAAKNLMVIYTGAMRLRVDDVKKSHDAAARIARDAGGYVAESNFSSEQGPASATITIRVPSLGLGAVIDRIAALGKLLDQQLGSDEVTQEYVDLTSRKRNLEREEERLLALLDRAGKIRDLLEVEQTIARVRGEIETIAGRMRYLEDRVAYSTLTVTLEGPQPALTTGGPVWTAKDVWREAIRSLRETGRALATMAIWIGVFIPVWVPLLLVLRWLARRAFPQAGN
jgi:hypothetical protein